ncbi:helix-turn-helix domain-containing protein [Streptomyces sp. FXJ1.172]|uniref:PucR family transcriptional regulator n=1 Tax=Streptomyces sp. FXJ1.172 TaxID=710705 RepID=UPI0007CF05DA|nr:helix-turn-helix domain-containing protein [Streptomyces sp. FXJ1.172]WEO93137.1 helix-turn-helix domain-containing protein [Streptomyces sp. FXJ1.172]
MESENPALSTPLTGAARNAVAQICAHITDDLPAISLEVVRRIRAEIPDYAVVPTEEHRDFVLYQGRMLFAGIAEQRPPGEEQIAHARELGRRRAEQGLPIELMLGAYHVTFREAWNLILRRATADHPEHVGDLTHLVTLIWTWIRVLTGNASEAYGEEVRRAQVTRVTLAHRLFAALTADPVQVEAAAPLAQALGYRVDGEFQALCLPAEDWQDDRTEQLRLRLTALTGELHCATAGARLLVLGQRHDPDAVAAAAAAIPPRRDATAIGVGLSRPGLAGAADSITDATQALSRTGEQCRVVYFADAWLAAGLGGQATRLAPLFTKAVAMARTDPHLAQAVVAFADHGLSVAAAARGLHLHPNSLAYRLGRWHELTGFDPRSGDGLVASLVALRLYQT